MMDMKEVLLLWFLNFLIKNSQVVVLLSIKIKNKLKNYKNQLSENLKKIKVYFVI